MTRILLTPLVKNATGRSGVRARLTARPTYPYIEDDAQLTFSQILVFDFEEFHPAVIDLDPPAINSAWQLTLTVAATVIERTVSFSGASVEWDDLIDVDPDTLTPVPTPDEVAAWEALRDQILKDAETARIDIKAVVRSHVHDPLPHPAYDDIPDLKLLFENTVLTGTIIDPGDDTPDLSTIFDNHLA